MNMLWPMAVIVVSNIFYHICSKSTPDNINPLASLTVTYIIGAVFSGILYFLLNKNADLFAEYRNLNWSTWVLGLSIVGLEVGSIYMYKVGWNISSGQLIHSAALAICLIFIGAIFYKENISLTKLAGIAVCLFGLFLINK